MSAFSSICHDKTHKDQIDVAYSVVNPEVRIWISEDEEGKEAGVYLTIEEAEHLRELLVKAIKRASRYE